MLSLGPIAFAAPWLLTALVALPALWWLLRVTPPAPRLQRFPAIRLLRDLVDPEETPARTPLWLLILRMVIAGLIILALARPLLNPDAALPGSGPVLIVVDNGWAAGRDWPARQAAMERLVGQAERQGRPVAILPTTRLAGGDAPRVIGPMVAGDALREAQSLEPLPWPADRAAAAAALETFKPNGSAHAVWLADGLTDPAVPDLARALQRLGSLQVLEEGAENPAMILRPPSAEGLDLVVPVERADGRPPQPISVRAVGPDGRLLGQAAGAFNPGATRTEVRLQLPTELRNEVTAIRLDGQTTAGAALLVDERWRRRPVGIVSVRAGQAQPLLSDVYYLEQALGPFAEVRTGSVGDLLRRELAVLVLTDVGTLPPEEAETLGRWVEAGGTLLRFAGPLLAQSADALVPVRLRTGDRALGGALSWSEPATLAPFPDTGPFAGLAIPADVTVNRQVLAEPAVDLLEKTWARLTDGTPLVTADRRGGGRVVLVHTTASPDWSNLPLSGLFVDMLRRVVAQSAGVGGIEGAVALPPIALMDGYGRMADPSPTAFPIQAGDIASAPVGPRHPPGLYGTADAAAALNLSGAVATLEPLPAFGSGVARGGYAARGETDLMPALLTAALILAIADLFIGLALRGLVALPRLGRRGTAAGAALLLAGGIAIAPLEGRAQDPSPVDEAWAIKATTDTWLAYVSTGDGGVDALSRAGLEGLSTQLGRRTAIETAGAMAVDLERDELSFFPLIYWPVTQGQPPLSDAARTKLNEYMRNGGLLLIDTRDQGFVLNAGGGETLMRLTAGLAIPPLAPVGPEHVLTKAFYLLQDFPGRYAGGAVWVEAQESRLNDGVSPIVIGSNDWAGAWAVDRTGRPLNPVVPGDERQREMAYRFGINLVMYALTGNYKADQVHVPAILERLGQ